MVHTNKNDYYYKYHTVSEQDKLWGLFITDTGYTEIKAHSKYPSEGHPAGYQLSWNQGRILHEYQLIYITSGEGLFESESLGRKNIQAGTIILLFPGEWHRYKPQPKTGWTEYWVGFSGHVADNIFNSGFYQKSKPIFQIGFNEQILESYRKICDLSLSEPPAFQQMLSGLVIQLLGQVLSFENNRLFEGLAIHEKINQARIMMRESVNKPVTIEEIASNLNVGYSWFRRKFKKYTGISPLQFLLQLRIQRARELLLAQSKSVKEIAFELNFDTPFYFSRLFKEKTGYSPMEYRKMGKPI
jgi:AraC-like DNA-binding protein